jgi:hypothetical protein
MFAEWQDFYLLVGSAAGALIGLLFVVATLNTHASRTQARQASTVYMTPIIFHYAMVLVLGAMAMVPELSQTTVASLVTLAAAVGLVHGAVILILFRKLHYPENPHWSDVWWYVAGPWAVYVGLAGVAALFWNGNEWAAKAQAAALVVLLLIGIRNAWDLVTWLAPPDDEEAKT